MGYAFQMRNEDGDIVDKVPGLYAKDVGNTSDSGDDDDEEVDEFLSQHLPSGGDEIDDDVEETDNDFSQALNNNQHFDNGCSGEDDDEEEEETDNDFSQAVAELPETAWRIRIKSKDEEGDHHAILHTLAHHQHEPNNENNDNNVVVESDEEEEVVADAFFSPMPAKGEQIMLQALESNELFRE